MPNWCGNTITLKVESDRAESAEERLKQIISEIKSDHSDFDFAKIVPPPVDDPIYRGEPSQNAFVGCDCKEEYVGEAPNGKWVVNGKPVLKDHGALEGSFAAETGFGVDRCPDHLGVKVSNHPLFWWNWNIANWGTKWSVGGDDVSVSGYNPYDRAIYISFDTAWSPPMRIVEALSAKYPDLIVHIKYAEMGMGFIGENTFVGGECTNDGFWDQQSEGETIKVPSLWDDEQEVEVNKEYYDNGIRLWGDPEFMSIGG